MAATAVKESTARPRTISFTEDTESEQEICAKEPQRFHRSGKYLTLPSKAQRPEGLLREISIPEIGPRADRTSKLNAIMSYIRAFSNTIEYELYDPDKWKEFIQSRFRAMLDALKTLKHLEDPGFR